MGHDWCGGRYFCRGSLGFIPADAELEWWLAGPALRHPDMVLFKRREFFDTRVEDQMAGCFGRSEFWPLLDSYAGLAFVRAIGLDDKLRHASNLPDALHCVEHS